MPCKDWVFLAIKSGDEFNQWYGLKEEMARTCSEVGCHPMDQNSNVGTESCLYSIIMEAKAGIRLKKNKHFFQLGKNP